MRKASKRVLSVLLALVLALSVFAVVPFTASAAENAPEWTQRDDGKIYFYADPQLWKNYSYITLYLYEHKGDVLINWNSKKGRMTDEGDNIWSFDLAAKGFELDDSKEYGVIFTADWSTQTCDLIFGSACLGDLAYLDGGNIVENNLDSNKHSYYVEWANADRSTYAPPVAITSIGNVIGEAYWKGETPYGMFCNFLKSEGNDGIRNAAVFREEPMSQIADETAAKLGLTKEQQLQAYEETGFDPDANNPVDDPSDECKHENVEFMPATEPTCGTWGHTEGYRCLDCMEWLGEVEWFEPTGNHDWYYEVYPADCGHTGMTRFTCQVCGEIFDYHLIEKTGDHHFEDGFCTVCGLPDASALEALPVADNRVENLKVDDRAFYSYTAEAYGDLHIDRDNSDVAIRLYDESFNVLCELTDDMSNYESATLDAGKTYIVELWQDYGDTLNAGFTFFPNENPPVDPDLPVWEKRDNSKIYFLVNPELLPGVRNLSLLIENEDGALFNWGSDDMLMTDEGDGIWSYDLAEHNVPYEDDETYSVTIVDDGSEATNRLLFRKDFIGDMIFMTGDWETDMSTGVSRRLYNIQWASRFEDPTYDDDKTIPLTYTVDYLHHNYGDSTMNSAANITRILGDLYLTPQEVIDSITERGFEEQEETDLINLLLSLNGGEYVSGDVNGDGKLSIDDVTALQRSLAEFDALSDAQMLAADANADGKVDVRDVTAIQRALAGFIE